MEVQKYRLVLERVETYSEKSTLQNLDELQKFAYRLNIHKNTEEVLYMITVNAKAEPDGIFEITRGDLTSSIVHPREIFKRAILANAKSFFLIHNHPSGNPEPSGSDKQITRIIRDAGELMGIDLLDHLIVGEPGRYKSLKKELLI